MSAQPTDSNAASRSLPCTSAASLPIGARISNRRSVRPPFTAGPSPGVFSRVAGRGESLLGHSGEDAAVVAQRLAHDYVARREAELADRAFMNPAALLHYGYRLLHLALGFEVAHEHHRI